MRGTRINDDPDKLKLGKGVAFVKGKIARLPVRDDAWEADFRALPQPITQPEKHYLGMVVNRKGGRLLADLTVHGKPTINDLATLLANAMRRPLDEHARRPRTIHLKPSQRWLELFQSLEGLGIAVVTEKKLPKIDKTFPKLLAELRQFQRAKMVHPNNEQTTVEGLFPSIARMSGATASSRSGTGGFWLRRQSDRLWWDRLRGRLARDAS